MRLKPDLFEPFRRAASLRLGLDPRPNQIIAARRMLEGCVVELDTGEGKTLVTAMAAAALTRGVPDTARDAGNRASHNPNVGARKQVLVATANDYLARRDAHWMHEVYRDLGLTVAAVTADDNAAARGAGYACDLVYGTIRQFGFDYLRYRLDQRSAARLGSYKQTISTWIARDVLLVDEADSVLIDEARTPMVISGLAEAVDPERAACLGWAAVIAQRLQADRDYWLSLDDPSVPICLTEGGERWLLRQSLPDRLDRFTTTELLHAVERALEARHRWVRDVDYLVDRGRLLLIDHLTGRPGVNRQLGGGLHQAIEAKESLELSPPTRPLARVTVQEFASSFGHLAGITATAWEDRRELQEVYGLAVHRVESHAVCRRRRLPAMATATQETKWEVILAEVKQMIDAGRAVLIGTASVEQSERVCRLLTNSEIEHVLLNARQTQYEAEIVALAGRSRRVTVATNMAGRGTDIRIDEACLSAGGLHVIISQPHAMRRIDRQLAGRCGRGGDPGTVRAYVSRDDPLWLDAFGSIPSPRIPWGRGEGLGDEDRDPTSKKSTLWPRRASGVVERTILRAQRIVERRQRAQRRELTRDEAEVQAALRAIGLDPHLDPLPDDD